jgi:hypothetical protein
MMKRNGQQGEANWLKKGYPPLKNLTYSAPKARFEKRANMPGAHL